MQLKIRRNIPLLTPDLSKSRRIAADEFDPISNRLPAATHEVKFFFRQLTIHSAAADESAFFVLENDNFERVTRGYVVLSKRVCDFDRTHRSHYAVVVSTFRNSVDVGSDE
jgi:hypothetical protein